MKNETEARALKTVPREKAFYFFTSIGNYTGESASSLKEFMEKINEVLEDKKLANEISRLRGLNYSGYTLRERLYNVVAKHYEELIKSL